MLQSSLLTLAWAVLMLAALLGPYYHPGPAAADQPVRLTADIALMYYSLAVAGMLLSAGPGWRRSGRHVPLIRWCWTLGWLAYVVHVTIAFDHVHHWSHARAVEHTRVQSGVGSGIYMSHLFTLIWTADVGWWWTSPATYRRRSGWIGWAVHSFMAFMSFCAAVVFESGPLRWIGLGVAGGLGVLLARNRLREVRAGPPLP